MFSLQEIGNAQSSSSSCANKRPRDLLSWEDILANENISLDAAATDAMHLLAGRSQEKAALLVSANKSLLEVLIHIEDLALYI